MGLLDAPGIGAARGNRLLGLRQFPGWVPVSVRASIPGQPNTLSNGTDTAMNTRMNHPMQRACREIRLVYANWYVNTLNGSGGEVDGPNAITVRAAVELGDNTKLPVFFNGQRDVVIAGGGHVVSDPIAIDHNGAADTYTNILSRTYVSVTSGNKWPFSCLVDYQRWNGEGLESGTAIIDKTTSGTITSAANYAYGPSAILGSAYNATFTTPPVVAIVGDSIAAGREDGTSTSGIQLTKDYGYISRALNTGHVPALKVTCSGEKFSTWNTVIGSARRKAFISGCTHVICEYGINDVREASMTLATLQARAITTWQEFQGRGAKTYATTLPPSTTSTDSWATTANQTVGSYESIRTGYNDWLRGGAPMSAGVAVAVGTTGADVAGSSTHPLSGYFEVADTVESARNSGKWISNGTANVYTSDGLHPNSAAHVLMAPAIDTTKFV